MIAFLYFVGALVSFVTLAYFDAKGLRFLNFRPRSELRGIELEVPERLFFGGLACAVWPVAFAVGVLALFYRGLLSFFSRQPKKAKIWTCPCIKPAMSYRDSIERCKSMTKSVDRPKCGVHHCEMVEEI